MPIGTGGVRLGNVDLNRWAFRMFDRGTPRVVMGTYRDVTGSPGRTRLHKEGSVWERKPEPSRA